MNNLFIGELIKTNKILVKTRYKNGVTKYLLKEIDEEEFLYLGKSTIFEGKYHYSIAFEGEVESYFEQGKPINVYKIQRITKSNRFRLPYHTLPEFITSYHDK